MTFSDSLFGNTTTGAAHTALSVTELVGRAKRAVEMALPLLWVQGEISGYKRAASGHVYFALKDENAQVPCVLYRHKSARVPVQLKDGLSVQLRVLATMYSPRGEFQLQIEEVRLAGVGALYASFAALKEKLQNEGLFDADRKRALPRFPTSVGLITSSTGAVVHDMVTTLQARWPKVRIVLYPSAVQGAQAPAALTSALHTANARNEVDVLIIGRGGGSIEDLWAFNDEAVARAIAHSEIPVVSAVGHDSDFTIADFVADVRAPTPTYAATLVVPNAHEWQQRVDRLHANLRLALTRELRERAHRLATLRAQLQHPRERLRAQAEKLRNLGDLLRKSADFGPQVSMLAQLHARLRRVRPQLALQRDVLAHQSERMQRAVQVTLQTQEQAVQHLSRSLELIAPQRVLERGYAFVQTAATEKSVSRVGSLTTKDEVNLVFHDGVASATINEVFTKKP